MAEVEIKFRNDKFYEETVVQALIFDHLYAEQMSDVLSVNYFNVEYLRETANLLFKHYTKYKCFPSYQMLATILKNEVPDGVLKDQIIAYLIKIKKEPLNGELEYVKENSLDFCKKRSLARALDASLSLIEEKKYEQILHEVQKAMLAGQGKNIGHSFVENFESRFNPEEYKPIPTPWEELNIITKGRTW